MSTIWGTVDATSHPNFRQFSITNSLYTRILLKYSINYNISIVQLFLRLFDPLSGRTYWRHLLCGQRSESFCYEMRLSVDHCLPSLCFHNISGVSAMGTIFTLNSHYINCKIYYVLIYSMACAFNWLAECMSARMRTSAAVSTDKLEQRDSSHITLSRSKSYWSERRKK